MKWRFDVQAIVQGDTLTVQKFLHLPTEIRIVVYTQELPDGGGSHVIPAYAV